MQLPANDLKKFASIISVQTKGLKKFSRGEGVKTAQTFSADVEENDGEQKRWSSIAGKKRKERLALLHGYANDDDTDSDGGKPDRDLNVIGTEVLSSSDDDDTTDDSDQDAADETQPVAAIDAKEDEEMPPAAAVEKPSESETVEKAIDSKKAIKKPVERKPAVYVHVDRTAEVQAARLQLPILGEEQVIMETISENSIVILAGETGSGKTTQVPQFLYEAGYAEKKLIGITEPRRVAAISMSKRVAYEMNLSSDVVSYLIRFEGNTTDQTKIKFMTDGVLLKEIESDFLLNKYSVIILDEAHERSVYTDILVGLLSRIVPLREKRGSSLKLIVMSATLRVEDFTQNRQLFKVAPPVLSVDTRQFPVTIHFNKRTADDYVKEAYNKTLKIHSKLPEGGILIFLTGQQEVNNLVRKLRRAFPYRAPETKKGKGKNAIEAAKSLPTYDPYDSDQDEFDIRMAIKEAKKAKKKLAAELTLPKVDLDNYKLPEDDTEADLHEQDDDDGNETDSELGSDSNLEHLTALKSSQPLWVLPLYSLLPSHKQQRVFEPPPEGARLCVVTTNVAETSLTIPNIKYVVDSGRQKTRLYDKVTGVSAFVVTFASKAAANQRAGRAGRTAAGHCYRLYSSAKYNDDFIDFAVPDIQKKPVEDLMLQMKCMGIDKVINFPFPSPPDSVQLRVAENKLKLLGALERVPGGKDETLTRVTPLGRAISAFPVAPRFGKMLALSHQQNLLPYTTCMVAALSVQEVLIEVTASDDDEQKVKSNSKWTARRKAWAGTGNSLLLGDPVVLLRAVGAAEYANSTGKLDDFCRDNGLRPKAITEIRKLRVQLTNEINLSMSDVALTVDPNMQPPTDVQAKLLRQIMLAGMCDQVARLMPDDEIADKNDKRKFKYAYKRHDMEEPVFLHSSSVLRQSRPEWVVYQEIYELQNGDTTKMFMRGVTAIEAEWLLVYAKPVCNIKSIKEEPTPPRYSAANGKVYCFCEATFGESAWEIPLAEIEMPCCELACKYFAMFFLNGDVFSDLQAHRKLLRSSPKNVVKSWAHNTPHILAFVNALIRRQVLNRQTLLDAWKKDKLCKRRRQFDDAIRK